MGFKENFLYCDQFGALFQLSIQGDDPQYRSIAGAIASIFINLTCIVYLLYLLGIWLADQIIPTVASQNNFQSEGKTFKLQESPFYFTVESYDNDTLHKYKGKTLYNVKSQFFFDGKVFENDKLNVSCKNKFSTYFMDFYDPICANIKDKHQYKLTQNYKERYLDDYLGYYLYPCNIEEDSTCMNDEQVDEFLFNLNGDARVTTITQEYDLDAKEIKSIPFDYYFPMGHQQRTVINLFLTVSQLTVERGIIFPEREQFEFVSKIEIKPQTVFREQGDPYVTIWVSLDRKQINVEVVYPKLPEILAQFQFVFSWLMMFGIVFTAINNHNLKKKILKQIGEMYFDNYQILEKSSKEYQTKSEFEKIKRIKVRIEKNLYSKFNFINIMYEISRLQFAIQTLINKNELQEIQSKKYSISFDTGKPSSGISCNQEDFYILSQYNMKQFHRLSAIGNRNKLKTKISQIQDFNSDDANQNILKNPSDIKLLQVDSEKQQPLEFTKNDIISLKRNDLTIQVIN